MIVTDEKLLRVKSESVEKYEDIVPYLNQIKEELEKHSNGVGLAAPQVGILKRLVVIRLAKTNKNTEYIILRNPVIRDLQDRRIINGEGCLSYPNKYIQTRRYNVVRVADENHPDGLIFRGIPAIAVQHEIDHLDGVLFFDREYKPETIGRNDLCLCGSKKKYKKCCGLVTNK